MSALINSLKSEIARVARKELKNELLSLRKAATLQRSEIAALKRQLKSLATTLKVAVGASTRSRKSVAPEEPNAPGFRYSAARLAAVRRKLGLSQAELGLLLGVSYQSVHKWEAGDAVPREVQRNKIAEISRQGKRAVQKQLQALQAR